MVELRATLVCGHVNFKDNATVASLAKDLVVDTLLRTLVNVEIVKETGDHYVWKGSRWKAVIVVVPDGGSSRECDHTIGGEEDLCAVGSKCSNCEWKIELVVLIID